jgi:DNA-binding NtrC family response regulator
VKKKILIVEDQFIEAHDLQLMLKKAGYEVCGIARSVFVARELIKQKKPELVLLDIFLKGSLTGIDLAKELREENIGFIYLSANSNEETLAKAKTTEPYGFIVKPFREKDLLVTLEIAQYRHEHSVQSQQRREADIIRQLEDTISTGVSWREALLQVGKILQQEVPFDFLAFMFDYVKNPTEGFVSYRRIGFNEYQTIGINELSTITGLNQGDLIKTLAGSCNGSVPKVLNDDEFESYAKQPSLSKMGYEKFGMRSMICFPFVLGLETLSICFYSKNSNTYTSEHVAFLHRIEQTFTRFFKHFRGELFLPASIMQSPVETPASISMQRFEGIVGNSHQMLKIFDQIMQVAPFDTSVLLLGESGTGKERVADCIHMQSPQKDKPFVKVNCAALPATLIESELFGHEKGSFTGATEKRIGKFQQADGGTIFLDEIGEMPIDLQVKLLRVLQEKEIEPVGGKSPIKINVRVIAATNKNLEKEVGEGRFRLDLYYRLNVFPIQLPPLRERAEDLLPLANHFINIYNRKSGKKITGLSDKAMRNMMAYHWPGNIRELANLIERNVLLAKGTIIDDISLPTLQTTGILQHAQNFRTKTIHENEREYIISVLKKCNGQIWGTGGAAELLNLPPSTLKSKMKKLGIQKENY